MRRIRRIAIIAVAIIAFNLMGGVAYANESFEQELLKEVNAIRVSNGLQPYVYGTYEKAADERAAEISLVWSHTRPDGTEYYTADSAKIYGENLYRGPKNVDEVTEAWMESKTHRELLLANDYKTVTVGVYGVGDGDAYITMEFGY